jgi:tyrosyl-tRNA synthetase
MDIEKQLSILTKGISSIVPPNGLRDKLLEQSKFSDKPILNIKLGIDPTSPDIHLGFAVLLRKLRQFQDFGHHVTIVIGDYTALIGDPSGKSVTRPLLSPDEIKKNSYTYYSQILSILDITKTTFRDNSTWLSTLDFSDIIKLASLASVSQLLSRDDFKKRFTENKPIALHELFYPLIQGYDSVVLESDIEIGGTDQLFNILMGRTLQESQCPGILSPQVGIFMPLLTGTDGVKKRSKSYGNSISISEDPLSQYSKIMSIPDSLVHEYFMLCTDTTEEEYQKTVETNKPIDVKRILAYVIVEKYHGIDKARAAFEEWKKIHSLKEFPENAPELHIPSPVMFPIDLVMLTGVAASKNEAKRLIEQGGVQINKKKISAFNLAVSVKNKDQLQVGKKSFFYLSIKES